MKIAVIGAGVSGLGAALALSSRHDVTLYEKAPRFGGHADTATVAVDGRDIPVDTGFIVYNTKNYPNLTSLFEALDVETEASDMTFSLSHAGGRIEYACDSVDKIFAQRWRVAHPGSLKLFYEILRFMKRAPKALAEGSIGDASLGAWLDAQRLSQTFRARFLYPMGGAIWSTAERDVADFPAAAFLEFFSNHELFTPFQRPIVWRTVSGGSKAYVGKLLQALGPRAVAGVGAEAITRRPDGKVAIRFDDGSERAVDHVVLATHSDQALALLKDADDLERDVLGRIRYSDNVAVLHSDPRLMPKRRKVWSSWNFLSDEGAAARKPAVSYWMNRLQNIRTETPLVVTLNPPFAPREALTHATRTYAHPQFDGPALTAQREADLIQGRRGVWFAGAWLGWGFHEDGLTSGLRVADALGARPDWVKTVGAPLRAPLPIAAE